MTIEVFTTRGALTAAQREELAHRLLTEVLTEEGAPDSVLAGMRGLTHVLVHEPGTWATGGGPGARYLVRVTVPGSWHGKELGAHLIPGITELIGAVEGDAGRLFREPHCQVQVVGLKEHAIGTLGRVTTATDITRLMTDGYRGSPAHRADTSVDPVCGMAVDPATSTITLEHDGTRYAFCAPVCRKVFAEELAAR
jgi:YHS domain-containing protein